MLSRSQSFSAAAAATSAAADHRDFAASFTHQRRCSRLMRRVMHQRLVDLTLRRRRQRHEEAGLVDVDRQTAKSA